MTDKRIALRPAAKQDVADIAMHYRAQGGEALALRWVAALAVALDHVAAHPAAGSPRHMGQVGCPDLRFWSVRHFPFLVFYAEAAQQVDVWRVLHEARDIPHWLIIED